MLRIFHDVNIFEQLRIYFISSNEAVHMIILIDFRHHRNVNLSLVETYVQK